MEISVGIDFGTTHSCISTIKHQIPTAIPQQTSSLLPSYVSFRETDYVVGDAAKNDMWKNLGNTIYACKRLIGRKYNDKEVQEDIPFLEYAIEENNEENPIIRVDYKMCSTFTPVEIASFILKELKSNAELFLDNTVTNAVICVPAYFNDKQRNDTLKATELAGFKVLRIINEPTAAAIAYSYDKTTFSSTNNNNNLLVYDLGGGTFDVSIIEFKNNKEITVKATYGDNHLGGEDFTNMLYKYVLAKYDEIREENDENNNKYPILNRNQLYKIKRNCEENKILLSDLSEVEIEIVNELSITITLAQFSMIVKPLFEKTINIVNETLKRSNLEKESISDIILIGGSSKMPQIPQYIKKAFPQANICKDINPNEAVSKGAAIIANEILYNNIVVIKSSKNEIEIVDNNSVPDGSKILINYKSKKGIKDSFVIKSSEDNSYSLKSSYEIGDNIILSPLSQRLEVNDIVIHAIGVEIQEKVTLKGIMDVLININEIIPYSCKRKYKTIEDNQQFVKIKIFEGENKYTEDNHLLDEFEVGPIPKLPKGEYQFYVLCAIDKNGILNFSATNVKGFPLGSTRISIK